MGIGILSVSEFACCHIGACSAIQRFLTTCTIHDISQLEMGDRTLYTIEHPYCNEPSICKYVCVLSATKYGSDNSVIECEVTGLGRIE